LTIISGSKGRNCLASHSTSTDSRFFHHRMTA
jgi:hypothetical protein